MCRLVSIISSCSITLSIRLCLSSASLAQSVVEGTGFRFEEICSVGYYVAGKNRRHLIPEKPRVVNVNFRSHSGVLNCAGGFLDLLFGYFPNSVKQLKKDYGLFRGARPGVFHKVDVKQLSSLLKENLQGAVEMFLDTNWSMGFGRPRDLNSRRLSSWTSSLSSATASETTEEPAPIEGRRRLQNAISTC